MDPSQLSGGLSHWGNRRNLYRRMGWSLHRAEGGGGKGKDLFKKLWMHMQQNLNFLKSCFSFHKKWKDAALMWPLEALITDVVQFLNSSERKEDPRLAVGSVSCISCIYGPFMMLVWDSCQRVCCSKDLGPDWVLSRERLGRVLGKAATMNVPRREKSVSCQHPH